MANNKGKNKPIFICFNNHVKQNIVENKAGNYVLNGVKNNYFKYVNDRYIGSPTNSAINNGYCRLMYGKGLAIRNQKENLTNYAKLKSVLSKKDIKNIIKDFQIQGMAYIQVIKSKGNTLNKLTHISVDKIAPEIENEDREIKNYYFSNDWLNPNKEENKPIKIPAFGTSKEGREIYAIKPYQMGKDYFSLPTYQSGLQYAELEEEISNFLISHMKNGMSAGYIVNVPDSYNLDADQKDEIERKVRQQLTGSNNAGKFIINFQQGEKPITVEVIEINDAHDKWQFSSTEAQNKILISHEVVSPLLFGVKDASGFSSNADELDVAEAQTLKRVIQPKQDQIINSLEEILYYYNINVNLYFKPLSNEAEADVENSFTGIQISSAIDIITKVKTQELTQEQASSLLRSMLSYPEEEIKNLFNETTIETQNTELSKHKIELESYTDYPKGATNNAKRALEWADKNGWGSCGTPVGKTRANQLAKREPISLDTVKRMAQFKRHQQYKDVPYSEGCGGLMWDAWGGDSGIRWAQTKLKELDLSINLKVDQQANSGVADALIELGEDFNNEKWIVLSENEVDYETDEHAHDLINIGLASTGTARPNAKSDQDSEDIVIRYKYVGKISDNSREFCKKMVKAAKVYRKEDIIQMENKAVNPGWGLNGADTYSIWLYKGGGACRHKWNRVIYLKKNGSIDVNSPLAKTITTSEARRRGYSVPTNDNLVSIAPNNMTNNGFVNK